MPINEPPYPITPDGRYLVVRGRLWRAANPALTDSERKALQRDLMRARSELCQARRNRDPEARARARRAIDDAKVALGERGSPWWTDGAPDLSRHLIRNTPYQSWFDSLEGA